MSLRFLLINGPNLNLLGRREPDIYGNLTFDEFFKELTERFPVIEFSHFQSNVEGELINALHEAIGTADGVIINPGGYSHTSVALSDAIKAIGLPVVEVHISNIHAREDFRQVSLTARNCIGSISGFGLTSYALATEALLGRLAGK